MFAYQLQRLADGVALSALPECRKTLGVGLPVLIRGYQGMQHLADGLLGAIAECRLSSPIPVGGPATIIHYYDSVGSRGRQGFETLFTGLHDLFGQPAPDYGMGHDPGADCKQQDDQ